MTKKERVLSLLNQGFTAAQVAKRANVDRGYVYAIKSAARRLGGLRTTTTTRTAASDSDSTPEKSYTIAEIQKAFQIYEVVRGIAS